MLGFRQKKIPLLVATDVVSRGIDVDSIELVVNYDVPPNEEDYVHRIGRTARAERKGEAFTLITPDDMRRFGNIEKLIERTVDKLPLPSRVGPGPDYNPNFSGGRGGGGGRGKPGGGGRGKPGGGGGGYKGNNRDSGPRHQSNGGRSNPNKGGSGGSSAGSSSGSNGSGGRRMKGSDNRK